MAENFHHDTALPKIVTKILHFPKLSPKLHSTQNSHQNTTLPKMILYRNKTLLLFCTIMLNCSNIVSAEILLHKKTDYPK